MLGKEAGFLKSRAGDLRYLGPNLGCAGLPQSSEDRVYIGRASDFAELVGTSYFTLKRLIAAGFVKGSQPSPGLILVDVASYFEHQEASRDPDFWTPARRAQYSQVL